MTTILAFGQSVTVVPLTNSNELTYVDTEDLSKLEGYRWRIDPKGYVVAGAKKDGKDTTVRLHRVIMETDERVQIDHINHNKRDNTKRNLREATHQENQYNVPKTKKPTSSRYKGVHFRKDLNINKWTARGSLNGKRIHLGHYFTEEEAALAYNKFALKHYGEFACLNNIEDVE